MLLYNQRIIIHTNYNNLALYYFSTPPPPKLSAELMSVITEKPDNETQAYPPEPPYERAQWHQKQVPAVTTEVVLGLINKLIIYNPRATNS